MFCFGGFRSAKKQGILHASCCGASFFLLCWFRFLFRFFGGNFWNSRLFFGLLCFLRFHFFRFFEAFFEAVKAASGVNEALFTSIKGMAGRTNLHFHFRFGRAGSNHVPAGANNLSFRIVFRMNVIFHTGQL